MRDKLAKHPADPKTVRKDELRQRCLARAQEHRRQLLERCRGAPAEPMDAQALSREILSAELASGEDDGPWSHLSHDAFIEIMTATEQTLLQELRDDLAALGGGNGDDEAAQQYEEYLQEEERLLALLEEDDDPDGGVSGAVPCPLCAQGVVWQGRGTLECSRCASHGCALRLFTGDHPAPLQLLRERMATLLQQHTFSGCRGEARCRLPVAGEAGMLVLGCQTCAVHVAVV